MLTHAVRPGLPETPAEPERLAVGAFRFRAERPLAEGRVVLTGAFPLAQLVGACANALVFLVHWRPGK